MAMPFAKVKKVTNLLDEKVRARLRGEDDDDHRCSYASGGGEHGGVSSLSDLVGVILLENVEEQTTSSSDSTVTVNDDKSARRQSLTPTMIRTLMNRPGDRFGAQLTENVGKAAKRFDAPRLCKASFRRAVMGFLRDIGYDAGVCKSKWEGRDGVTAGSYEYIDVLESSSGHRYIIDLDFSAEFEIARATEEYENAVRELPAAFVGRAEELKQAVRLLAEGAKRSMRARGMNPPPWRKGRYMQNKWLGPYKRTTGAAAGVVAAATMHSAACGLGMEVQCREVGFAPASHVALPAARMR